MASKLTYYYEMYRRVHLLRAAPKILNYMRYRCLTRKAKMSVHRYTPQIAALMVTLRCNLNCGYCNVAKLLHRKGGECGESEADLEKIKKIFSNPLFKNSLLVDLFGGEPLLVKDFAQIVSYLVKQGHLVNTATNGLLLFDQIADLKRAGISRINLSLYEANRSIIERDLEKINQVFSVHMSIVLLRSEVERGQDKLLKTARFIHDAGCRSLRFWIYRSTGADPRPEEIINDSSPAYIEFRKRMEDTLPGFCLWPATVQTGEVKKNCPQLWQLIMGDMLGNIIPCCGILDTTLNGPNSNLFNSAPDVLLNHPMLVTMREQLLNPECDPPGVCKTCNLLGESGW